MNRARAGSCIHAPIYIESSDSSLVVLNEHSALTGLTAESAVHGVVNQEAQEYLEGVVNSYSNATMTFKTTADNGDNGETVPIQTIQVPIAGDLTSNDELALRASQQLSIGGRGCANNMLNEPLDFQVQSHGVCLPEDAGTGGVRHSPRKRNQVNYYEGPARSAKKECKRKALQRWADEEEVYKSKDPSILLSLVTRQGTT
nr:uncharacterized protein LOC113715787 isoform X2 [Coffea arabica]